MLLPGVQVAHDNVHIILINEIMRLVFDISDRGGLKTVLSDHPRVMKANMAGVNTESADYVRPVLRCFDEYPPVRLNARRRKRMTANTAHSVLHRKRCWVVR